jgi:hypothetical protein
MKLSLLLILGVFVTGFKPIQVFNCDKIEAIVTISKVDAFGNYSAEVKVKGVAHPEYYIFFYPNGHLIDKYRDVSSNKIEGLSKGSFFCSIADNNGCVKKVNFTIE